MQQQRAAERRHRFNGLSWASDLPQAFSSTLGRHCCGKCRSDGWGAESQLGASQGLPPDEKKRILKAIYLGWQSKRPQDCCHLPPSMPSCRPLPEQPSLLVERLFTEGQNHPQQANRSCSAALTVQKGSKQEEQCRRTTVREDKVRTQQRACDRLVVQPGAARGSSLSGHALGLAPVALGLPTPSPGRSGGGGVLTPRRAQSAGGA